jgi:hypothetical protein
MSTSVLARSLCLSLSLSVPVSVSDLPVSISYARTFKQKYTTYRAAYFATDTDTDMLSILAQFLGKIVEC